MFTKQTVISFEGLNSNVAPELLNDGEARDIYNFRMEKIGKLVSRNGYSIGLYADVCNVMLKPEIFLPVVPCISETIGETDRRRMAYIECQGLIGMGEYILEEHWRAADTDRLMVYYVRTNVNNPEWLNTGGIFVGANATYRNEHNPARDQMQYSMILMSPLSGKFKNKILMGMVGEDATVFGDYYDFIATQDVADKRTVSPQSEGMEVQLYAPNKSIGINDEWIKQYATIKQYRNKLIISDPINGDMFIEDMFSQDYDPPDTVIAGGEYRYRKNPHLLSLRPNALETFDIDIVDVGLREGAGEENDAVRGIRNGMALYRYTLPKKHQVVSTDHFENKLSNADWLGISETKESGEPLSKLQKETMLRSAYQRAYNIFRTSKVKMRYFGASAEGISNHTLSDDDEYVYKDHTFWLNLHLLDMSSEPVIFSNASNNDEYYDVFGKVVYAKEEYDDGEGTHVTEIPADVYIWDDVKLTYYGTSANVKGQKYLTDMGRMFTKKSSNAPRVTELDDIPEGGQHVPLGGWKYRFVWDFGDGVYSVPSSDLWVPDKIWSAVKDEWIEGDYQRPQQTFRYGNKALLDHAIYPYEEADKHFVYPNLFDDANNSLTKIGELVKRVKDVLYKDVTNKYGNITLDLGNSLRRGEFATMITATYGDKDVVTNGVIYEGIHLAIIDKNFNDLEVPNLMKAALSEVSWPKKKDKNFNMHVLDDLYYTTYYNEVGSLYNSGLSFLAIPIFKSGSREYTYDSLFDDEGRFRLAWINEDDMGYSKPFSYQLVFPGVHPNVPSQNVFNNDDAHRVGSEDFITRQFVNTIHHQRSTFYDTSNIYLNFICYDDLSMYGQDLQNAGVNDVVLGGVLGLNRPATAFRAVKNDRDRLINVSNTDIEALNRLIIADAMAGIKVMSAKDRFSLVSEALQWEKDRGYVNHKGGDDCPDGKVIDTLDFEKKRYVKGARRFVGNIHPNYTGRAVENTVFIDTKSVPIISQSSYANMGPKTSNTPDGLFMDKLDPSHENYFTMGDALMIEDQTAEGERLRKEYSGIDVYVYGQAERLIAIEQLCSYFPSSLLFNAPRFSIEIPNDKIPKRAKKLLIFRTKSINANEYDPHSYGLVKEVELSRLTKRRAEKLNFDEQTDIYKRDDVWMQIGNEDDEQDKKYHGMYFFDDVQDVSLDFSYDVYSYEGLRKPLWSRFNIAVNENVYYGNYYEEYNPLPVRTFKEEKEGYLSNIDIEQGFGTKGYDLGIEISYKIQYIDYAGVKSKEIQYTLITATPEEVPDGLPPDPKVIVIFKFLPSSYDPSIEKVKIYRHFAWSPVDDYVLVGELGKDAVGIFVDKNKDKDEDYKTWYPNIIRYESGVRWSERYRPDWLKYENMAEYASGDGKQITGLASLDGNLVVLKETSMYRVSVQAADPPLSRTDQISPEIGCIAPNTLLNVDNNLYFLSWKGWVRYDNNVPTKIDIKFDEELQYYIQMLGEDVRDATSGYNPITNEIYLNLPKLPENPEYLDKRRMLSDLPLAQAVNGLLNSGVDVYDVDFDNVFRVYEREDWYYEVKRRLMGNIYVMNLSTGFAYKFGYQPTLVTQPDSGFMFFKKDLTNKNGVRLYSTNSMGEMRSGEIMPSLISEDLKHAGVYIETPYGEKPYKYIDEDEEINAYYYFGKLSSEYADEVFPMTYGFPVRSAFKSKLYTGDDETLIKRVRKTLLNLYSRGYIRIEVYTNNYDSSDDRIKNDNDILRTYSDDTTGRVRHVFSPTEDRNKQRYAEFTDNGPVAGRYTNILQIIPQSQYGEDELEPLSKIFDLDGKPIKYGIEIYTEYRTQLNEIAFYWRPIHTYLG